MLVRFWQIKDAVIATLALTKRDLMTLNEEELSEIKQATDILGVFSQVTAEISAEKGVTISKVLYFIKIMNRHVSSDKFSDEILKPGCKNMVYKLKQELKERFDKYEDNEVICQATFLDPRFKQFSFINRNKYEYTVERLRNRLQSLQSNNSTIQTHATLPQPTSTDNSSAHSMIWEEFDSQVQNVTSNINPRTSAILEIDRYIKEPILQRTEDPLKWWNDRQAIFPALVDLVKKRLCITATSVPCERQFSKAGLIMTDKRSRMKASKLSKVMFLQSNLPN
uniref:Zinc finger BED domain-containing protein 1-like n=1 Tax=Diabrotica virgifera virgifera TaxID=50390 RepID=A0A6P7GHW3_DIAVI